MVEVPIEVRRVYDRYRRELDAEQAKEAASDLLGEARRRSLVLLTATRHVDRSGAKVLAERLRRSRARHR